MLLAVGSTPAEVDPFLLLFAALALDTLLGVFGGTGRRPNPLAPVARAAAWLGGKLDRERRSDRDRFVRGLLVLVLLVGAAVAAGFALRYGLRRLPFGWVGEMLLVLLLVTQRRPFERARRVAAALGRGGAGRDGHGIVRTTVETCAATFATGLVGPAFWYLLLGLPGLLAYRTARLVDRTGGRLFPGASPFGAAAAALAAALAWVPARLAAAVLALAAIFAPHGRPAAALRTALADAPGHPLGAVAWPIASMAGALDLALAGPPSDRAGGAGTPWLGGGRARATAVDLRRALYLYAVACLLHGIAVGLLAVAIRV